MAFDGTRRRTVLFGGRNHTGLLGDTWEWDGENWTQVADSGPARRHGHAMAFDPNRQRIVLFGGDANGRLNDTWEWDGNEWVQQGDSGPSARIHPAMAYDTGRSRLGPVRWCCTGSRTRRHLGMGWHGVDRRIRFRPRPVRRWRDGLQRISRCALWRNGVDRSTATAAGACALRSQLGMGRPALDRTAGYGAGQSRVPRHGIR